ncbi:hypothetical protein MKW92_039629 [Papaver armeniacum]|nr:hypothetical protein MKW92_039629 [Papaver armeniacum]
MIDKKMEKTFVLAYPCFYYHNCIGNLVAQFEELAGLKITEMRCMNVSEDFAREHLNNINWNPEAFDADLPSGSWVGYLTSNAVVAMIIEGDNSVQKVSQLTSKKERPFWDSKRASVYASKSGEQALLDIALWFRVPKFDITQSKQIVFMLPRGKYTAHGGMLKQYYSKMNNFALENMCVFLIKPLAFRERCVGEILDAIESNSYGVRGLTLVKISVPNKGWLTDSLSTIDDDEYGLAVVANHVKSCFNMRSGNIKKIDHDNKVFEIGSDYLHKSEPGQGVLEAASEFFHHGFSVWEYQGHRSVRGGIFEASLVGLESLQ